MQFKMKALIKLCIAKNNRLILFFQTSKKYADKFNRQLIVTGRRTFGHLSGEFKNQALAAPSGKGINTNNSKEKNSI